MWTYAALVNTRLRGVYLAARYRKWAETARLLSGTIPMNISVKPLNNEQAASLIGIAPDTLRIWRVHGKGPKFVKLGDNKRSSVMYYEADVLAWLDERKFTSTSAYNPAAMTHGKSGNLEPSSVSV